jgi:hypothetical protein
MHTHLLRLRALVGYLGESDQFGWWNTSFLSETGQRFLQRPFPRSAFAAGLHSVSVAARQLHDDSVGKGHVAHLFRLQHTGERELAEALRNEELRPVRDLLSSGQTAMDALSEMSRAVTPAKGAVRVGRVDDLFTQDGLGQAAGYYHAAFSSGDTTFPYFSNG